MQPRNVLRLAIGAVLATAIGSGFSGAGPPMDTDGDGIPDYRDNCTLESNTSQIDTSTASGSDVDGIGNACDMDYDGNGTVGASDLVLLKFQMGLHCGGATFNADIDADGNCAIGASDLTLFKLHFSNPPGPSACTPTGCE